MRAIPLFIFVFVAFSITQFSIAQQTQAPIPTPAQRDPLSISILERAVTAAGSAQAIRKIADFAATGTITHNWSGGPVSGQLHVQGRGHDQLRMETRTPDGTHLVLLNHGKGSFSGPNYDSTISPMDATNLALVTFPISFVLAALDDPNAIISTVDAEPAGPPSTVTIHIIRGIPGKLAQVESARKINSVAVLIDSTTFTIVSIRHPLFARGARARDVLRELNYSNFKEINGLVLPLAIDERIDGQLTWRMNLSTVEFNQGLTDDIFRP